jgi:hypothetical protein
MNILALITCVGRWSTGHGYFELRTLGVPVMVLMRGSHVNILSPNPCLERAAAPLMNVGVELSNQLLNREAVISHHVCPPLGIQHYPYPWSMRVKIYYVDSPLHHYLAINVGLVSPLGLVFLKTILVIDKVVIPFICGTASLPNKPLCVLFAH